MRQNKKFWEHLFENIHKGDKVQIINPNRAGYNKIGIVERIDDDYFVSVKFGDLGNRMYYKEKDLKRIKK